MVREDQNKSFSLIEPEALILMLSVVPLDIMKILLLHVNIYFILIDEI